MRSVCDAGSGNERGVTGDEVREEGKLWIIKDLPSVSALDCRSMITKRQSLTHFAILAEITNFPCNYLFRMSI